MFKCMEVSSMNEPSASDQPLETAIVPSPISGVVSATANFEAFVRSYVPKIRKLGGVISAREVRRKFWKFRHTDGACLLHSMVERGLGQWMAVRSGPKGGRPTMVFVLLDDEPAQPVDAADEPSNHLDETPMEIKNNQTISNPLNEKPAPANRSTSVYTCI